MSILARLIIVDPANNIINEPDRFTAVRPLTALDVLRHYGDSKTFVSNFYPVYSDQSLDSLPVPAHRLPDDFQIADFTGEEEFIRNDSDTPFYYVTAGDLAKAEFESKPHPLDVAMMAYIRALPPEWPIIPYVIF